MPQTTRFAPSPTGWLHRGHAYAALFAHEQARRSGGLVLVLIEDIDGTRSRPEFEAALFDDLAWLGLTWEQPVRRQSQHLSDYTAALHHLQNLDLLYPCFCTRKAIQDEIARAGQAPHGPDGALYPGTCRNLSPQERADRIACGQPYALRLDVAKAAVLAGNPLAWNDAQRGDFIAKPAIFGDVVLARKDTPASYHLAVVVDDALQDITLVTRGEDLLEATHLHRLLQELLGLPVPHWHHHRLIVDENGRRLAKRDSARSLRALRDQGWTPEQVRQSVGV
ncbi:MAG: tRNA glutamyl-Q(34) synthetase GluQRS [Prosthecobacter sp.]|nr:tRNA glutamyl-Q(34) synthetase GluQRS [Prosthecobacter sp.]